MTKIKLENRIEKAVNAFFEDDEQFENTQLTFNNNCGLLLNEKEKTFTEKADTIINLLKQIFLFLPGVLILHLASFATVEFYSIMGINFWMLFWFASGIFMTWVGIGDLKNKKHFLIPLAVILSASILAVLGKLLSSESLEYSFYLFPLLFITPVLVKNWISKTEKY